MFPFFRLPSAHNIHKHSHHVFPGRAVKERRYPFSCFYCDISLEEGERGAEAKPTKGVGREGGGAADPAKSELDGRGLQAAAAAGKALPVFRNAAWRERACDRAVNPMREKTRKSRLYSAPPLSPSRVNAREVTPGHGCGLFVQSTRYSLPDFT